jgi:glycosyltransferase involved in cell wall biosynthesis
MRRALVLAYHFPPIGGAGAQRPLKIVRALPDYGYEPIVITGPGPTSDRWTPADATLGGEITCEVRRIAEPEPLPSGGWRGRAERALALEGPWASWWRTGAANLARTVPDVDLVYAWMQPYESGELAAELASELRVPYVADLGDPWALDEMLVYLTGAHRRLALARMRKALKPADAIVMSTPEAARRLVEVLPQAAQKPLVAIPNGFDADDLAGPAPVRADDAFRIVHTGYLHTELGLALRDRGPLRRRLGGAKPGVDILTRSHVHLLEAVQRVLAQRPDANIEVRLAGVLSPTDVAIGERYPFVQMPGYLDHADSIALLRSADLLFLPMHELPEGERATIVPGKTYEYVASGRPILAAVPEGDARDILEAAGTARIVRPSDVSAMTAAILAELDRRAAGEPLPASDPALVGRYEYRHLAGELAEVFDRVLATPAAVRARALV